MPDNTFETVYIGVGSNINPEINIIKALKLLNEKIKILETSTFYKTKAISNESQADYLNGVWKTTTNIDPVKLKFKILRNIESRLNRIRNNNRYSSRTIDLDILLYDNKVIKEKNIIIPDPDIYTRSFIAYPLYELNKTGTELIIPDTAKSISSIIKSLDKKELIPDYKLTESLKKIIDLNIEF